MVVGDDHIYPLSLGIGYGFVGSDARIAGQDQTDSFCDELFQGGEMDTMGSLVTTRHIEPGFGPEVLKCGEQDGRGCLTIDVKVAPYADCFLLPNS